MLVLTRKSQESVVVGGSDDLGRTLKVTVLQVRGGQVSLGFEGPPQIAVHRWEVWERIRASAGPERPIVPRRPAQEAATCRDVHGGRAPPEIE